MKENLKETIKKGKWLGNTLLTILLIIVIVAVVVALNIFIEKQNFSDIDLTTEKLYSLSEESKAKISSVSKDTKITLYAMSENPEVEDYAKLYAKENSHITYEELTDITQRPDLQQKYGLGTSVTTGLIIVEAGLRSKLVSVNELYTYDYITYEQYDVTEQVMTNAILDVNLEKQPNVYFVTNHAQNVDYYQTAKELLQNEANAVSDLDLLVEAKVPENCDVLILTTLKEDFSEYEKNIILEYINNGGNMMILANPNTAGTNLPNFQAILDVYGASISNGVVYEQNIGRMINGYTNIIIPLVSETSEITKYIFSDGDVTVLGAGIINFKSYDELEDLGVTREDIISTTSTAYLRTDPSVESYTITEADQGLSGEPIASIVTKKISDDKESKLVICADSAFASDMVIDLNSSNSNSSTKMAGINFYSNRDFVANSISYLTNRKDNITVRKDTGVATYTATAREDKIIRIIITALPIMIILIGIIVWQIRRRKK